MTEQRVEIASILSHRTKQGLVEFLLVELNADKFPAQQIKAQWDLAKAREIHQMLGQAIEAAVSDTLIYAFLTQKVGLSDEKASMGLLEFRELRQGSKGVVYPT